MRVNIPLRPPHQRQKCTANFLDLDFSHLDLDLLCFCTDDFRIERVGSRFSALFMNKGQVWPFQKDKVPRVPEADSHPVILGVAMGVGEGNSQRPIQ